jgi:ubiquinone/menaquinone biosynthesis C-methylase UbiE
MNVNDFDFIKFEEVKKAFWQANAIVRKSKASIYYHHRLQEVYKNLVPPGSKVLELGCGAGDLLASLMPLQGVGIDFSSAAISQAKKNYPHLNFYLQDAHAISLENIRFDYIVISELVNDLWDVQSVILNLRPYCHPGTRLILNFYSHLWNGPLSLARLLGQATPVSLQNWFTPEDANNMLEISGFEKLKSWRAILIPFYIPVFSKLANRYLAKIFPFNHLCITNFLIARPHPKIFESQQNIILTNKPSVSVIIAARNEAGHIKQLISRIPQMGHSTEIIFVEGNSTDDTYEVIESCIRYNPLCKLYKQTGKGKGDAVRRGFEVATGEVLMILDADITVPPEDLPKFYDLIATGAAEFVNGVRLVYPMENEAMRFFNLIGNKFFSWTFSYLLGQPIRDTLCGTKVLWKKDYQRIANGRKYFGDFDPFGDFDLLFGAARLNLKIVEVPIRYRARVYGETNISRWSHGWLLLKMVVFAARRIKFI